MPKRVPALSVKTLAAARPGARPFELVDGYVPGLRVRILPTGTRTWFEPLHQDLADGGKSQFLWFLKNLKLGGWHPARDFLKTAETAEQQRMSGDSVSQWSQSCIDADAFIGASHGMASHDLGTRIASEALREAYTGYCKQHGLRAVNVEAFGKTCPLRGVVPGLHERLAG